ncbi:MAG: DNA polymerase I, partial [Gammaproteobacteria bacterium]|nr:DNA polymerase I [Gammaproteobacteria bacterium]NIR98460.1 DNA polymerase I [Gammaproteobacteria bacterium]NIT64448.1 DNA polymerase I [Gammaproteobacteria bacterium]NIV21362.1 DNA polymerase I [Gammaproteobacteria bacterium]NIY33028.1 DNA polymerase I [Gammaproteobacteria bacterium]
MVARPASKPLVLVDGSSYLYRAYHALPPLTNSRGEPTGAVYGVINMLRRLLKDYDPDHVAVVFDARGKTFRDELFDQYKANRPAMPDDLAAQIQPLLAVVRAMGLPLLQVPGVEADDVIGTLAARAAQHGRLVVISTGDKDMAQLVDDGVTLTNTMTGTTLDREGVAQKFGVAPERITDLLALMGDPSDNIPGVPKVGPKTAAKWLNEYGDLDGVLVHAGEIKGKVGESLRANLDQLELSRRLVVIRRDLDLEQAPEELRRGTPDREALREWFRRLEFKAWLAELLEDERPAPSKGPAGVTGADYQTVFTEEALHQWLQRLERAPLVAFDTETTSLEYMQA